MRFDDPTLYGRDDETDEYSDSGAYGESLEEDLDEEEEEEEEPVLVEEDDEIIVPAGSLWRTSARNSVGWWRRPRAPPKKKAPAKKAPAKKAPAKESRPRSRPPRKGKETG